MGVMMMQQGLRSALARVWGVIGVIGLALGGLAGVATADADPAASPGTVSIAAGQRIAVDTPREDYTDEDALTSPVIFLDRCRNDCQISRGPNDAKIDQSTIPNQEMSTVREFTNSTGQTGGAADTEWNMVVQCMKEVYSPFAVQVVDVRPAPGVNHHKAIVAGSPRDIALESDQILGVAPLASDCSAIDNVISFSFANVHPTPSLTPAGVTERVLNICWTAAQESAHAFGLDHSYSFTTGNRSACNDPMTYRNDCGGEKFFRNDEASCGETAARPCKCAQVQNSHLKLLSVFGPGSPITGPPTVTISTPASSGGMLSNVVTASAGSKRGISRVELLFNGHKWTEMAGLRFEKLGQPNPGTYPILVPTTLPNSIVDIQAVAYDDLGTSTTSAVVTATRGAPCQAASACAKGQKCEAGKCFWDPPVGELGNDCEYPEFCKSGLCRGTEDKQICTKTCLPFMTDSCGEGYECILESQTNGVCFIADSGGCCSVDRGDRSWLAHLVLAAAVLGFVTRRRRRRT
jgi:MYXO-CTERM domain-containing protein